VSEPKKGTLAKLVQVLKQRVSHAMRQRRRRRVSGQLPLAFPVTCASLRRFWQRRYYDFNVYSAQKIREKLDYIHTNPAEEVGDASERLAVEQAGGAETFPAISVLLKTPTEYIIRVLPL